MKARSALLGSLVLLVSTMAGCVLPEAAPLEEPGSDQSEVSVADAESVEPTSAPLEPSPPPADPYMTGALVSDETTVSSCMGVSPSIVMAEDFPFYCAQRRIVVQGVATDIALLPALVSTFHGVVHVTAVDGNAWGIDARLSSNGLTEEHARQNLEKIGFEWSCVDEAGDYAVKAEAFAQGEPISVMSPKEADIELTIPRSIPLDLHALASVGMVDIEALRGGKLLAETSSGDITLRDLDMKNVSAAAASGDVMAERVRAEGLELGSSSGSVLLNIIRANEAFIHTASGDALLTTFDGGNLTVETSSGDQFLENLTATAVDLFAASGDIVLDGTLQDAKIRTSSGDILATLTPSASGTFDMSAASGSLDLALPEGETYGYMIEAQSSSGSSDVFLEDGKATSDDDVTRFVTNGFETRAVQTTVLLEASSGSIRVMPA